MGEKLFLTDGKLHGSQKQLTMPENHPSTAICANRDYSTKIILRKAGFHYEI